MKNNLFTLIIFASITLGALSNAHADKNNDHSETLIQNVNINGTAALLLGFQAGTNSKDYVPRMKSQAEIESGLHSGKYDVLTQIQDGEQVLEASFGSFSYQLNPTTGTLDINSEGLMKFAEQSLSARSKHILKLSSSLGAAPDLWLHFSVHNPEHGLEPIINGRPFAFDLITASLDGNVIAEEALINVLSESKSFTKNIIATKIDSFEIAQSLAQAQLNEGRFYLHGIIDNGLVPEVETEVFIDGLLDGRLLTIKWVRHHPKNGIPYGDDVIGVDGHSDPNSVTLRFDIHGNAWACGDVTFFIANGTADIAGTLEHTAVRNAFAIWEDAVNLDFIEVGNAAAADIVIRWGPGNHGIADPADPNFDGLNGVLAHAFVPPPITALADPTLAGDIHFDDAETWTIATSTNANQPIDQETVAIHEIGHALGLLHSSVSGSIMAASYSGSQRFLGQDDIAGINEIYGGCPGLGSLHYSGTTSGALALSPPNVATLGIGDAALLNIFSFRYNSSDHHLERIAAIPPARIDGGNGATVTVNGTVAYHDKNEDDLYAYIADWLVYPSPDNNNAATGSVSNANCVGQCTFNITGDRPSAGHVFALNGFDLTFQNSDHHIDEIEVSEANGILTVSYNDKNNDDPFSVAVQFTYLPPWDVANIVNVGRNSTNGDDTRQTGMTDTTAIAGFRFDFLDNDHHIRKVTVDTGAPNLVEVSYFDKNADDNYAWSVRVVELVE